MTAVAPSTVDPCTDAAWAQLAVEHGTLFHSPGWLGAIRDAFAVEPVAHILVKLHALAAHKAFATWVPAVEVHVEPAPFVAFHIRDVVPLVLFVLVGQAAHFPLVKIRH